MRFTYDDLQWFQEDHTRRELLDGELHVDGLPADRAQQAVTALVRAFGPHVEEIAGVLITHPLDRTLDEAGLAPDLLVVTNADVFHETYPDSPRTSPCRCGRARSIRVRTRSTSVA